MPFASRRKRRASDADDTPSSSTPDPQLDEDDNCLPPSSAPASPVFWGDNNQPIIDDTPIRTPSPFELPLAPGPFVSETPPASPGGGPLTSPFKSGPAKEFGGRPRLAKARRNSRGIRAQKQAQGWAGLKEAQEAALRVQENMLRVQEEKIAAEKRDQATQNEIFDALEQLTSDGTPMHKVFELLFTPNQEDHSTTAVVTKVLRSHGTKLLDRFLDRAPDVVDSFLSGRGAEDTSCPSSVVDMKGLGLNLQELALTLWDILAASSTTHNLASEAPETRRDRNLVFTTVCTMMSILRSQKANNFQAVIDLFLFGFGASKREIEVFAHVGISLSYKSVMNYLDTLSQEGVLQFRAVWRECMCSLVWDNLNIAFRVESQRLDNKNHFNNGTTATLIPIYNPFTNEPRTVRGTLPLSMKPMHTSTMPIYAWTAADTLPSPADAEKTEECLIWQLKSIALKGAPTFPLPAMYEDESSLDRTITVINKLFADLQTLSEDLKNHGLVFANGDLLTDNLVNTVEGSRWNSADVLEGMQPLVRRLGTFHAKMARCHLVVNEHWAETYFGRLKVKESRTVEAVPRATPNFVSWASSFDECVAEANLNDFNAVADKVYGSLYTTAAYDAACDRPDAEQDIAFENSALYNRDSLVLPHLGSHDAIPEDYAKDPILQKFFLHNWLVNLTGHMFRFKEVDILQEHQNFWAKIVYNAKALDWDILKAVSSAKLAVHSENRYGDLVKYGHIIFLVVLAVRVFRQFQRILLVGANQAIQRQPGFPSTSLFCEYRNVVIQAAYLFVKFPLELWLRCMLEVVNDECSSACARARDRCAIAGDRVYEAADTWSTVFIYKEVKWDVLALGLSKWWWGPIHICLCLHYLRTIGGETAPLRGILDLMDAVFDIISPMAHRWKSFELATENPATLYLAYVHLPLHLMSQIPELYSNLFVIGHWFSNHFPMLTAIELYCVPILWDMPGLLNHLQVIELSDFACQVSVDPYTIRTVLSGTSQLHIIQFGPMKPFMFPSDLTLHSASVRALDIEFYHPTFVVQLLRHLVFPNLTDLTLDSTSAWGGDFSLMSLAQSHPSNFSFF
ncbi:hypothetical protein C8R45DRAFT_1099276 [Mycena sanguinolenta]|nr:hypothetical protein C8R45DRAFT_1099276 [Mycena sanguinolenta]